MLLFTEPQPEPRMRRVKKFIKSILSGSLIRYRVRCNRPVVALTFDDGPRAGVTDELLDVLQARGHSATFFVLGRAGKAHPELLTRIQDAGCELANHSFLHSPVRTTSHEQVIREIEQTDELLHRFTGGESVWYRPPRGGLSLRVCLYLWRRPQKRQPILWSVAIPKEHLKDTNAALAYLEQGRISPGDIILLHDDHPGVVSFLPGLLDLLDAKGLRGVTISELTGPGTPRRNEGRR